LRLLSPPAPNLVDGFICGIAVRSVAAIGLRRYSQRWPEKV
jgi:hypothetical protein